MAYLLDSDVFIQAKNLHYGLDFCPAFWGWLEHQHVAGKVLSVEKVETELFEIEDDLSEWAKKLGPTFFLPPDGAVISAMGTVSQWVTANGYTQAAVHTFLQIADYYLIAHALARGHIVVTHEKASDTKKQVKIPTACVGLGVKCMTPFEMLRRERARFVLGGAP